MKTATRSQPPTTRLRRRWPRPGSTVGAIAVVVVSVALGYGLDQSNKTAKTPWPAMPRDGSIRSTGAVGFASAPDAYRLIYRVEQPSGDHVATTTDALTVRRPFDSFVESLSGPPPGTKVNVVRSSRFGALALRGGDGSARLFYPPPGLAVSDLRPDQVMDEAVVNHKAERREVRRVAGAPCQVYRVGSSVQAGELIPLGARPGEYAGRLRRSTRAGARGSLDPARPLDPPASPPNVDTTPRLDDSTFVLPNEEEVAFAGGNGFVRKAAVGSLPEGPGWVLPAAPTGFDFVGHFAVSPPDTKAFQQPLDVAQRVSASTTDIWARGPDLIVFEQGIATSDRGVFKPNPYARVLDLGAIGRGEAFLDLRGNEARTVFPNGRFVRITGTVPLDQIIALARSLQPVQGTGIQIL